LFTCFYSVNFLVDGAGFRVGFVASVFVSIFGLTFISDFTSTFMSALFIFFSSILESVFRSVFTGAFGFTTVSVFLSSGFFFSSFFSSSGFFVSTLSFDSILGSLVVFAGLAVLGLYFTSTSFFSLFFSSSYLPITLFIPVFGITALGLGYAGSLAGGFKDYLGLASGSFLSSVGFMASFLSGTTLAVYGLKGFLVLSPMAVADAGPAESLSFGVALILLSVIFLAVGSSPSFNILVAYKS
jgi:hypothetical protein